MLNLKKLNLDLSTFVDICYNKKARKGKSSKNKTMTDGELGWFFVSIGGAFLRDCECDEVNRDRREVEAEDEAIFRH